MPEGFVYILKKVEEPKQDVGHYYIRSSKFGLDDYKQKVQDEYRNAPREIIGYIKTPKYRELREMLTQFIPNVLSITPSQDGFVFKHEQIVELFRLLLKYKLKRQIRAQSRNPSVQQQESDFASL